MIEKIIRAEPSSSTIAIGVLLGIVAGFQLGRGFIFQFSISGDFTQGFIMILYMAGAVVIAIEVLSIARGETPSLNGGLGEDE